MTVRLSLPRQTLGDAAAFTGWRGLTALVLAVWLLGAPAAWAAGKRGKSAHAAAHGKKSAKKAKSGAEKRAPTAVTAPAPAASTEPTAAPTPARPPAARPSPTSAAELPAAVTPVAAVPLPRAGTPATAGGKTAATKVAQAKPGKANKPAAVELSASATATTQGPASLPGEPTTAAHAAVALPIGATPTTAAAPPRAKPATTPVATAWALPQVPRAKLQSDLKFESIVRLIQANKFTEALSEVDALLEKSPNDDELKVQRARLLYWLDRRQASREYLAPVLERHPEDAEIRELDAQLKLADGDVPGALAQYRALEIAGDGRPELHQRIIDLSLELDDATAVTKSLRFGGHLSDEQEMAYTRMIHPWFADVAGASTLHSGVAWWRADAHLGRRFNKRWSALLGGIFEQRYSGTDLQRAEAVKGELYFGFSRIDGMLHLESSPNKGFLPIFDGRLDLGVSIIKELSVGVYGRYAHYATTATSQVVPTTAWTLAPNVIFYVKEWTFQPGYMLMNLDPAVTTTNTYFHTGFLKARWEPHPRWMAFAWLYLGTDPTFVERYGVHTPVGTSLVLGGEHWWTPRWGTRASVARTQPFDSKNDPFTEFTLVLRGRL